MTVTIVVVAEAGAMIDGAAAVLVVTIVEEGVVAVAQEMEAEAGAMMIVVHRGERLSLLRVLR